MSTEQKTSVDLGLVQLKSGKIVTKREHKWMLRFFRLAQYWADVCSKDPRTKVGAAVVGKDQRQVALGYNGFPPGVEDLPERLNDRDVKYHYMQHAERAAIDNAYFSMEGATLYVTKYPCSECAKSIVTKKFACVVCPAPVLEPPWEESSRHAQVILAEGGVQVIEYDGK